MGFPQSACHAASICAGRDVDASSGVKMTIHMHTHSHWGMVCKVMQSCHNCEFTIITQIYVIFELFAFRKKVKEAICLIVLCNKPFKSQNNSNISSSCKSASSRRNLKCSDATFVRGVKDKKSERERK